MTTQDATLTWNKEQGVIILSGAWSWNNINESSFQKSIDSLNIKAVHNLTINGLAITKLDTTGVYFICKILKHCANKNIKTNTLFNDDNQKLLNRIIITQTTNIPNPNKGLKHKALSEHTSIFKKITALFITAIAFLGQICVSVIQVIRHPTYLDWKEVIRTIRNTGINGIFVVLLLNFLIATTLTYEMAPQFTKYGANVFIVNFLGIAMLKEVSPLLTAIIIAGRTGSSITAEIGTMKVQEEIDAIKTMGISPFQKLVLPKILGVVIATPLLTALADVIGLIGGAIIANYNLNITYELFIDRTQNFVSINNYTAGLIKSIAFGLSIGFIGCLCGFTVKGDSKSIGGKTTLSVVLSIIMIVLLDAIFAIIFLNLGM